MSDQNALTVSGLSIAYGPKKVVNDVNLSIGHGKTFGLIGLNGAGKTTIIKTIVGLREANEGQISVNGLSPSNPQSKKNIAFLPERFEAPWFLKGIEFIQFSMKLYGKKFDEDKVFSLSDRLALNHTVLNNKVQTYSKGMRQKLGILANILSGCSLLILDEPMSGLDPQARLRVKDVLREAREEGRTIFLSSHILADMDEICDEVAVLHGSEIVFDGAPSDLRKRGNSDSLERAFIHIIEEKAA